jgi:hypothetical protein
LNGTYSNYLKNETLLSPAQPSYTNISEVIKLNIICIQESISSAATT